MKILVYAEVRNGKLKSTAAELLTIGRKLADGNKDNLHAVLLGEGAKAHANTLATFGAGKVFVCEASETNTYQGEPHIQALASLIKSGGYTAVLGPASPTGRDFFPRLSIRCQGAMLTDVVSVKAEGSEIVAVRPVYAGKCLAEVVSKAPISFVTVRPNVIPSEVSDAGATANVEVLSVSFDASLIKAKIVEVRKGKSEKPDLTEATTIISGGRGVGSAENFKVVYDAAELMGATPGASRAAVDSGYAPHDMQVGQTGKTVNPNLYVAAGISGSIQHLAGMRTSKVIVAINTDADAPIFQKADYGIIADLFQAVPILSQEIKNLKDQ